MPHLALAQQVVDANPAQVRFASVWRLRGDVTVFSVDGRTRTLRTGDTVYAGERVRSERTGEVILKTEDSGFVAVRAGASFSVEKYLAEGKPSDQVTLRLISGALRLITGWIGQSNHAQYVISTPTATIGIRGTDHEPFVMTTELSTVLAQDEGTYNKVNRGGTTLEAFGSSVDITPGKVGFARSGTQRRNRALSTLLLPVLLNKIPEFYVPGEFDAELDALSESNNADAARQLEEKAKAPPQQPAPGTDSLPSNSSPRPVPTPSQQLDPSPNVTLESKRDAQLSKSCGAEKVAKTWLTQLDAAIGRRDPAAIIAKFARDGVFAATARDKDGNATSVDISREEFVESTITAMKGLTEFRQRRLSIEGQIDIGDRCDRVNVKSFVIEEGMQSGKRYRFESVEEYILELRAGRWLGVKATVVLR